MLENDDFDQVMIDNQQYFDPTYTMVDKVIDCTEPIAVNSLPFFLPSPESF